MLNLDDFVKRLELVMDYYGMSGGIFADRIGIQRSSLSHLLSGRNKPSLEFVMKIVSALPEVDLDWILNGNGAFPKSNTVIAPSVKTPIAAAPALLFPDEPEPIEIKTEPTIKQPEIAIGSEPLSDVPIFEKNNDVIIENIVIFYSDGTFTDYKKAKRI